MVRINLASPRYWVEFVPGPPPTLKQQRESIKSLRLFLDPDTERKRSEQARRLWAKRDQRKQARAYGKCEACLWMPGSHEAVHVHHVRPRCLGTNHRRSNLMVLCPRCHRLAHWLYGNADPGDWIRLWSALLITVSAIEKGEPRTREDILAAVASIEAEEAAEK